MAHSHPQVSDVVVAVSLSFQVDYSWEAGAENILDFKVWSLKKTPQKPQKEIGGEVCLEALFYKKPKKISGTSGRGGGLEVGSRSVRTWEFC